MHRLIIILLVIFLFGGGYWYYNANKEEVENKVMQTVQTVDHVTNSQDGSNESTSELVTVIAQNLDTPWAIAFLPDGSMLVTERRGSIKKVDKDGIVTLVGKVACDEIGEGGLLGIVLEPGFDPNNQNKNQIYVYCTYKVDGNKTFNQVARYDYPPQGASLGGTFGGFELIVNNIPGASNHNGGRIKFGPDGYLYIGTGDAENPSQAQDTNSLAGKILRVDVHGTNQPAPGNPFGNLIYSYGHRNVQGLAWDKDGQLWATEHGPSGGSSCCDELNKIEMGKNYGWPTIQDTQTKEGMVTPLKSSGKTTWAPSGMAYALGDLFFAGLRGQRLYHAEFKNGLFERIHEHFEGEYGRLREVILGPDNMLYVTTSNKDGRGTPKGGDDKILRIDPASL